jgi:hypothetical protein
MSTASELDDVRRRRAVSQYTAVAKNASMAAMAISAVSKNPKIRLSSKAIAAVRTMLDVIDQLQQSSSDGSLEKLTSRDHIAKERYRSAQVVAQAAHQSVTTSFGSFPELDRLFEQRASVDVDAENTEVDVHSAKKAREFAKMLDELASVFVTGASDEDRSSKASQFAVA